MITEDFVSFETAKLLKEKGFDEECISVYCNGKLRLVSSLNIFCNEGYGEQILTYTNSECNKWNQTMISAPTCQMAMKWLREVHHIRIGITFSLDIITYEIQKDQEIITAIGSSRSYENMVEEAIKNCLENLI